MLINIILVFFFNDINLVFLKFPKLYYCIPMQELNNIRSHFLCRNISTTVFIVKEAIVILDVYTIVKHTHTNSK